MIDHWTDVGANNFTEDNIYIQSLTIKGNPYERSWSKHEDVFIGDVMLGFEMGSTSNRKWAGSKKGLPPSMTSRKY